MAALKALMRLFSYVFHGLLALFLLAISIVAMTSRQPLRLDMLPWQGPALTYWVFGAAVAGLALVILAVARRLRPLFFLWTLVVLVMMVDGFFFGRYYFAGPAAFHSALYLIAAAFVAVLGAGFQLRRAPLR